MNLKVAMLNEGSQTKKVYILYDILEEVKLYRQLSGCRGPEVKEGVVHKAAQGHLLE